MDHQIVACAAETIRRSPRIAVPLGDVLAGLARAGTRAAPTAVERALRNDPRFRLLHEVAPLPALETWPEDALAAYAPALAGAGIVAAPVVVLRDGTARAQPASPDPASSPARGRPAPADTRPEDRLGALLRATVVRLLETAPELVTAAQRALTALGATDRDGTAHSTTRPPDPLPAERARQRAPLGPHPAPPTGGSPRGSTRRPG